MALLFRDSTALIAVMRSGVCSTSMLTQPAYVADRDGSVLVAPEKSVSSATLKKLKDIGVVDTQLPKNARKVSCWMEAIQPVRVPNQQIPALVLITTPRASQLIDVAAQLVRLGCDRQELLIAGDMGVIRIVDPPTYTVVRALDHEDGLCVYAPDPVGQEIVWTELGFSHPFAEQLRANQQAMLLINNKDGWRTIADKDWMNLDKAIEFMVPGARDKLVSVPMPPRRKVPLRLSNGRRETPSLWVLRDRAVESIDKLLAYLPEDIVGRLTFAVCGDQPTIILRSRTGRHAAPDLSLSAEEYAPLCQMPDVYAPTGAIVEPPLRRERLRQILDVKNGEILWLAHTSDNQFKVERIADSAFSPLADWAEYVIHTNTPTLQPWMRSTLFDFAPMVSTGLEWASKSVERATDDSDDDEPKQKKGKRSNKRSHNDDDVSPVVAVPKATHTPKKLEPIATAHITTDKELAELEAKFIALDVSADDPERMMLFESLGDCYARLRRRREAGLCYSRAIWEASADDAPAHLDTWITADLAGEKPEVALNRAVVSKNPQQEDIRLVAALAARKRPEIAKDPHKVTRWLDDHDADLDMRTLWLARLGLASLAGGDSLGLARVRDRILSQLAGGLPVERELPAFMRLAGRSGALGNTSGDVLGDALDKLSDQITKTKRKRSPVEAPVGHTQAYINLQLALGYARVGKHDKARGLVNESQTALAAINDPVHAYLSAAYSARVDHAIAGLPSETALGGEHSTRLSALDRVSRYKVDRLREASLILEPLERPDAIGAFSKKLADGRGPEFAALRVMPDMTERANAVSKIIDTAEKSDSNEHERLVGGVLDVLLELSESWAVPHLLRVIPMITKVAENKRALLYAAALVVAGHFGRTTIVRQMQEALGTAIATISGSDLDRVLQQSLRALRRIGLRHEIADLLAKVEHAIPASRTDALRGRLALASGMAFLGDSARALPIFEHARKALTENMTMTAKLELTRSLALAYAQAPLADALTGIAELSNQLKEVTDSFGTNSHYCLSVLHFVDSLVLGITSDDLALGESGRRFIEDDEHLIRRRLHRDIGNQ